MPSLLGTQGGVMSFCARPNCPDLADELLQVLPPDGKTRIPLCAKHAKIWRLEEAAKDIKSNPPFGSEWNRRHGKRNTRS